MSLDLRQLARIEEDKIISLKFVTLITSQPHPMRTSIGKWATMEVQENPQRAKAQYREYSQ